jgi:hypothetical protein
MYGAVIVPGMHLLVPEDTQPLYLSLSKNYAKSYGASSKFPTAQALDPVQRQETLAVISAGCAIILAGLGLIVTLQIGEWYVEKNYQKSLAVAVEPIQVGKKDR